MRKHAFLIGVLGLSGLTASTAAFLACSSSSAVGPGADAGTDLGQDEATTLFETSTADAPFPVDVGAHDAGGDTGTNRDGTAPADASPGGNCSAVTGQCDIVAQNCPDAGECDIFLGNDGGLITACAPTTATEHLAKGAPCCPSDDGTNSCDPGLECNGGNACTPDAAAPGVGLPPGWGGSRCTPRCCPADSGANTANCGTAGDGGTQGHCDLSISYGNVSDEYTVCTYPQTCEPLHIHPCISGLGCEVEGMNGTATCSVISNPNGDAGAVEGQPCEFINTCADGLVCITPAGDAATSQCAWMCHVTNTVTPFDAGELKTTPGYGGCPAGETCNTVTGFPTWLGACNK